MKIWEGKILYTLSKQFLFWLSNDRIVHFACGDLKICKDGFESGLAFSWDMPNRGTKPYISPLSNYHADKCSDFI